MRARGTRCLAVMMAVVVMSMFIGGCGPVESLVSPPIEQSTDYDQHVQGLWDRTVSVYLSQSLWLEEESYDACHYLMVPLEAAFGATDVAWREEFHAHFSAYAAEGLDVTYANRLNELHYLYLVSRYVTLSARTGQADRIAPGIREHLAERVEAVWSVEVASSWAVGPFDGLGERLSRKLAIQDPEYSYYRALVDEDLLVFGIGAELQQTALALGETPASFLGEIAAAAGSAFRNEVEWNESGWLLQPGAWSDHPDYANAGNPKGIAGMQSAPLSNVAVDTSHAHRLPVILCSLRDATTSHEGYDFYQELIDGLGRQMLDTVLVPPSRDFGAWRTTNYMDGGNGVFRWGYVTQGPDRGYEAYELSGTFGLGWWAFLRSEGIRLVYQQQAEAYPLSQQVIGTYVGPNTSRQRNPLVALPQAFENGYMELLAFLGASI